MATAPAVQHSADWYENNVLDATPEELLAIEYICCYCPGFLDTYERLANETQDDSTSRLRKAGSIWLVSESKEPILQMSCAHPKYTALMLAPLDYDDDNSHAQVSSNSERRGRFPGSGADPRLTWRAAEGECGYDGIKVRGTKIGEKERNFQVFVGKYKKLSELICILFGINLCGKSCFTFLLVSTFTLFLLYF